jgi:hypothetical protein
MAGKDEYVSVLERAPIIQRDMSSPAYRAYLQKQQALEGSYPEMFLGGLGALARQGANAVRGMMTSRQAPVFNEYQIAEMQRQAAFNSLTPQELAAFQKTGAFPADWAERVKNASYIGSSVGKVKMPGTVRKTDTERLERATLDNLVPVGRRAAVDAGLQTANQVQDLYEAQKTQRQPTQEDVVRMLRGYAYGGMIPNAGNNKLV